MRMWLNKAELAIADLRRWPLFLTFGGLGAVASLGQAPFHLPFVSLLAFALVFLVLGGVVPLRRAAFVGWAFGFGYFALGMQWLVSPFLVEPERHAWMAPFALGFMSAGLALFWAAAFAAAHWARSPWGLVVSLPLAELGRAYVLTGFPWGMPAYGLVETQAAQLAAWFGAHGLNLLFLLFALVLSQVVSWQGVKRWIAGGVAIVCALGLMPGPAPMQAHDEAGVIRLIQPNAPQHQKWDPDFMPIFFDRALASTSAPETDGMAPPDLILWPETSLPATLNYADHLFPLLIEASSGTPVVVGANRREDVRLMNAAALIGGQGQVIATYDKHHLVPFGEYMPFGELLARVGIHGLASSEGQGFSAGAGAVLMDLGPLGKALPLICYEAVFPQDVAAYQERPDFLMQITNDAWFGKFSGPYQHLAQAQMRAIEQGLPLVRAANTGVSALIDARGRIVASLPLNQAGHLDVQLTPAFAAPLYARTGDLPLLVVLILLYSAICLRRRRFRH